MPNCFILITVIIEYFSILLSDISEFDNILNTPSISNLWVSYSHILDHSTCRLHSSWNNILGQDYLLHPALDQAVAISHAQQKKQYKQHAHPRDLFVGQCMLVCNFSAWPTWLCGTIIKYNGPLSYQVKISDDKSGIDTWIHIFESVHTPKIPLSLIVLQKYCASLIFHQQSDRCPAPKSCFP